MQSEPNYNWDDIVVGGDPNHSENFFAQKHIKHEKFSDDFDLVNAAMASAGIEDNSFSTEFDSNSNKENNQPQNFDENQNKPPDDCHNLGTADKLSLQLPIKNEEQNVPEKPRSAPANIIKQPWSAVKRAPSSTNPAASTRTMSKPPHAYQFKDVYQRNKEVAMQKRLEEEKKNRMFHSRPVPKFDSYKEKLERRKIIHTVTAAVTPMVLKKSNEAEEKRRQKLEEWKRKNQPPKFTSREAAVLREEPFKPKKTVTHLVPKPFNLLSDRRLENRKQFDEKTRRVLDEKKKQVQNEEDERKKREDQEIKELRKMATFKARQNPFSK